MNTNDKSEARIRETWGYDWSNWVMESMESKDAVRQMEEGKITSGTNCQNSVRIKREPSELDQEHFEKSHLERQMTCATDNITSEGQVWASATESIEVKGKTM